MTIYNYQLLFFFACISTTLIPTEKIFKQTPDHIIELAKKIAVTIQNDDFETYKKIKNSVTPLDYKLLENVKITKHNTSLMLLCIHYKRIEFIKFFLKSYNFNPYKLYKDKNLLHYAAQSGNENIFMFFIENYDLKQFPFKSDTCNLMHSAFCGGNINIIKYCNTTLKIPINPWDLDGAIEYNHCAALSFGEQACNTNYYDKYTLQKFSSKEILQHCINKNNQNHFCSLSRHTAPIFFGAIARDDVKTLTFILDNYNCSIYDRFLQISAFDHALRNAAKTCLLYLKKKMEITNTFEHHLQQAIASGSPAMLTFVKNHYRKPFIHYKPLLCYAARNNACKIIKKITQQPSTAYKEQLDYQNDTLDTPLNEAIKISAYKIIIQLLAAGATLKSEHFSKALQQAPQSTLSYRTLTTLLEYGLLPAKNNLEELPITHPLKNYLISCTNALMHNNYRMFLNIIDTSPYPLFHFLQIALNHNRMDYFYPLLTQKTSSTIIKKRKLSEEIMYLLRNKECIKAYECIVFFAEYLDTSVIKKITAYKDLECHRSLLTRYAFLPKINMLRQKRKFINCIIETT